MPSLPRFKKMNEKFYRITHPKSAMQRSEAEEPALVAVAPVAVAPPRERGTPTQATPAPTISSSASTRGKPLPRPEYRMTHTAANHFAQLF